MKGSVSFHNKCAKMDSSRLDSYLECSLYRINARENILVATRLQLNPSTGIIPALREKHGNGNLYKMSDARVPKAREHNIQMSIIYRHTEKKFAAAAN